MKGHSLMRRAVLLPIFILFSFSHAEQSQPISDVLKMEELTNTSHQWSNLQKVLQEIQLKFSPPIVRAAVLCFIAASISSAGGIGGGGLFVPILTIVGGLDLKTASTFSAFMVAGGSTANILCTMFITCIHGGKSVIDFDIALLSEPCLLLGVSIGVVCNIVFPEWLITILFVVFLSWTTSKTCRKGVVSWKLESEEIRRNGFGELENGVRRDESNGGNEVIKSLKEPLMGEVENFKISIPWTKFGALVVIWLSFFLLYVLRGDRDGQSIIPMEPCGEGYWILSSLQIPLAITFTTWILHRRETSNHQEILGQTGEKPPNLIFPIMALLAGILGGVFGIGGGMLISPLLLHIGIPPEVTAATCSMMVFFSSTMSSFQYLLIGMEHKEVALIFAIICFFASILGVVVVQRAIEKYGRASLIVFSVSTVMALSTVLLTSFGAIDVWRDYASGEYMGFKLPC
ncbi:hypothetical protein PVL29_012667 [Vitis rotundifolia]|uniref:Sulfite exporter TauE/SafE family protein n=1 Tax=Vitis rotundifolia TaxID=103349 RepID=A0AA39DME5_VITRO|nr:hypothetical protein PVL29_012667 [Vitis rotundifolia]